MDLAELIKDVEGVELRGQAAGVRVGDLTEDSRTVMPGSLFVARGGLKADGRAFIDQAIGDGASVVLTDEAGAGVVRGRCAVLVSASLGLAAAMLAERFYGNPGQALRVCGVTGTNGKTTVAHLAHRIINAAGERTGLIGTVEIDDGVEVAPSDMTTIPALELSRTLAVMVESGCSGAVMEVSSHALAQHRVAGVSFDVGVFTNLTRDHLDYHGTMEAYAAAKATLFASLAGGATAVVNADDPWHETMLEGCAAEVVRCSSGGHGAGSADCDVRVVEAGEGGDVGGGGTAYELAGPWGSFVAQTALVGGYNGMNLLQACCVAWAMGVDGPALERAASGVGPPVGRLELVSPPGSACSVYVDFAHTHDALEKAIGALRGVTRGRLWVVFGAGGDKDRQKRPAMGEVVARLADRFVITSDNPRTEDPSAIVGDIVRGVPEGRREAMDVHIDRGVAIRFALGQAGAGDTVLIAGRGHEPMQEIGDGHGGTRFVGFLDRDVARRALIAARGAAV